MTLDAHPKHDGPSGPSFITPPGSIPAIDQKAYPKQLNVPSTGVPTPMKINLPTGSGSSGSLEAGGSTGAGSWDASDFTDITYGAMTTSTLTIGSFGTAHGFANCWYDLPAGCYEVYLGVFVNYSSGATQGALDAYIRFQLNSSLGTGVDASYGPFWSQNAIPTGGFNGFCSLYVTIPSSGWIAPPTAALISTGAALGSGGTTGGAVFRGRYLGAT